MAEKISSRRNPYILRLRALQNDGAYRRSEGEYVLDGYKLLAEALEKGAGITSVLYREGGEYVCVPDFVKQYIAPGELFDYASPMKNSPGPIFTVRIPEEKSGAITRAIVLENVQDPGNVGTVIRTAGALGIDAVILCGACADLYSPKTARATMGAIFRQRVIHTDLGGLKKLLEENGMRLIGAALRDGAADIRETDIRSCAVAIGSEGRGLSEELLSLCDGELIIPMTPGAESLNAATAAAIVMWEMSR